MARATGRGCDTLKPQWLKPQEDLRVHERAWMDEENPHTVGVPRGLVPYRQRGARCSQNNTPTLFDRPAPEGNPTARPGSCARVESSTDSDQSPLKLDGRKAMSGVIAAVLLASAAFTGLSQFTGSNNVGQAVSRSNKLLAGICVFGQLLAYAGYTFAYRGAARASGGPRYGYLTALRIVVFGSGTAILGASVGGLAVDFWALRRSGSDARVAARRVLAIGTLEWSVLSIYAFLAALLVLIAGIRAPMQMALGWLLVIPACFAAAIYLSSPQRVEPLMNPQLQASDDTAPVAKRTARWLLNKLKAGLGDSLAGVVLVRHILAHPGRYLDAAVGYPIYWAGDMFTLYLATRAFGSSPDVISLILAYATGIVISSLPLPAGGAGGVEATVALALHATGVAWTPALLGVFLYRLLTFWLPAIPALALLPTIRRLNDELESTPHTQHDPDEQPPFRPDAGTEH